MSTYRRISVNTSLKNARIFDDYFWDDTVASTDSANTTTHVDDTQNKKETDFKAALIKQENSENVSVKIEPINETEISQNNKSDQIKPSCSGLEPKMDNFWNIKREIFDEDSLQSIKQELSSPAKTIRMETYDESTNDSCSNQGPKSAKKRAYSRSSPYQKPGTELKLLTDKINQCVRNLSMSSRSPHKIDETQSNSMLYLRRQKQVSKVVGSEPDSSVVNQTQKKRQKIEHESDPNVLARRQKQIDFGKNTIGYDNYIKKVPRYKRTRDEPSTPDKYRKYSRRGWDSLIKHWRLKLHHYD